MLRLGEIHYQIIGVKINYDGKESLNNKSCATEIHKESEGYNM